MGREVFLSPCLRSAKAEGFISSYHASQECLAAVSSAGLWRVAQAQADSSTSSARSQQNEGENREETLSRHESG